MPRYTADHQAGRHGRDAALLDASGRRVLNLAGGWAVTDDRRRTLLFATAETGSPVRSALLSGLAEGIAASAGGGTEPMDASGAGSGGVQAVKRARRPTPGVPLLSTLVAVVRREPGAPGAPGPYAIERREPGLPPMRFAQQADAALLAGYRNGFPDPRFGVYDLLHADGRPIARHWATVDGRYELAGSVVDVADEGIPLPEVVMLCLARFLASRG